jgi:3'-phosphoadenosine 5'-phosphosulfate sulfotransferase (PAPS reductase)/FAD synthetase
MSFKELAAEQTKPLEYKINEAVRAVKDGFSVCVSRPALAFSGGKDSTVLWDIIRRFCPEESKNLAVIFGNTGVEYPESLKFALKLGSEWGGVNFYEAKPARLAKDELKYEAQKRVLCYLIKAGRVNEILKVDGKLKSTGILQKLCPPELMETFKNEGLIWRKGTPKSFWWCADQYGYPILGKSFSKLKARRINIDCFLKFSNSASEKQELLEYYNVLKEVKISQACCDILKKEPSERLQKKLKIDVIFKGLMAAESRTRKINFCTRGYLFKSSRKYINTPFYHCNPLSMWTDADIWEYIHKFDVPYSPLYDLEYIDEKNNICKMKRNGCFGCYTDFGRKSSHMNVLRQTHPGRWKAVMKYGMAGEIVKIRRLKKYRKTSVLDGVGSKEQLDWTIENRSCAFD